MTKKLISIVTVLVMMICVSCGKSSNNEQTVTFPDVDHSQEPVTITYLTIGDKPTNGRTEQIVDRLNEILIDRVNAKLDIYYVSWDNYLKNYDNILDSGNTSIDLVGTAADWLDLWPNILKGNFMPLSDEMLRTYCPNTYKNISDNQWEKCSYNGTVYFIPENEYTQWTNHGFAYRQDIAEEAGISKIKSWSDLDSYVEYIARERTDMIAWDSDGSNTIFTLGYIMSAKNYVPIYEIGTYGLWGAYDEEPEKIVSPYYEGDEFIDFAVQMKKWNELGVWRQNLSEAQDNDEEFYQGISALEQHHTKYYCSVIRPNIEIQQPDSEADFYWFGEDNGNLVKTSICHGAMAVYSHSKNPEKALMVYDILRNDEECYRLINYGIEGIQYNINNSGMLEKPSGYNSTKDSFVINFWWGRRDALEIQDTTYAWQEYYDLLEQYDRVARDYPWDGVTFDTFDYKEELDKIADICDKYIPEISYGQYDGTAEKKVAEFRAELKKAGFENATERIQKLVDTY